MKEKKKPGPRPKIADRRTEFLQVYFSPSEKKDFQDFCDQIGVTASAYIRDLIDKDREKRTK